VSGTHMQTIKDGSITSARGFEAAGVACGLKAAGALDLALVYSPHDCVGAGVFTTNAIKAAPLVYDHRVLLQNPTGLRGVVINSGCANACTGEQGLQDAEATALAAATALGVEAHDLMVMSTGVIGMPMPMDKILRGLARAVAQRSSSADAGHAAARAIMTTDTRPKETALLVSTDDGQFTIAGMAKGAGMIHPNMATMLCLVTSDAKITPSLAQRALDEAIVDSFNMITVDGDTSTNDTVLLMASGLARMQPVEVRESAGYEGFARGLAHVLTDLAKAVVRDGEGATRFIEITVRGARATSEARQVARTVARSVLVKTAIYGGDANWGRIICAVGYSGVAIDPQRIRLWLDDLELVRDGAPYEVNEERASDILAQPEIPVTIDLGLGHARATAWTCDLSHKYVDINAHYRT